MTCGGGLEVRKKSKLHRSVLGKDRGTNQAKEAPRRDSGGSQDHHRALSRSRGRAKLTSAETQSERTELSDKERSWTFSFLLLAL